MKAIIRLFVKRYVYAVIITILLTACFTYTLLDAFVIEKAYGIAELNNSIDTPKEEVAKAIITSNSYQNENISIKIDKIEENGATFYVADITLSDISYLMTAFAKGTYGKNITDTTSQVAEDNNAIFAINGDFYGFRDDGLIIRNGTVYRDVARKSPYNEALAICEDGQLKIINEGAKTGNSYLNEGILQTFSFGPTLVTNGKAVQSSVLKEKSLVPTSENPRTAIGQIAPLHYIIIVVDGRTKTSTGMSLSKLALEFEKRGCSVAYNLDGGGSSTMYFNGEIINNPTDGRNIGERKVSDIIYFVGGGV